MSKVSVLFKKIVSWIAVNKTKSIIIGSIASVAICGTAVGISIANKGDDVSVCQHVDSDNNSLCDNCGESYTDGKDIDDSVPCQHRDADDNSLCDKCGERYTDGKDVEGSTPCSHRDADDNSLCDKCGESYTDGSTPDAPVNSITLDKAVANIEVGDTVTLNVLFKPENATDKNITWISSDSTIALVNNGIVVGVKTGTTTIIAMTANGKTATCLINVSPKTYYAESITLNKASVELPIGYTDTLTAMVLPDYTTDKSVIWSSSDSSIAKVENGVVTALSTGTVTITATTTNGKSATCTVKSLFIPATDIIINEQLIYVNAGENKAVNATTVPENATVTSLICSSSDTSIATVNDGIITGVSDGIAIITVSTADGTISKSFNVVVENSAEIIYTSYGSGYSVTGINKCTETLIIPDTYKGKPVTSISANVFGTECRIIKKLYIGNNITTLPDGIFRNCTNLETLYVPNVKYDYIGDLFGSVQTEYIGTADDFVNETLNGTGDWIYYGDSWLSVDGVYVYVEALHLSNNNILSWQSADINGYYMSVPRKVLLTAYYIPKSLVNIYNKNQSAITVESDSACLDKVKDLRVSINGESLSKTLAEVISLSDVEKIKSPGTHSLKVYYGGFVCEVSITVTEHTASAAVQENYVDSNCTEDGSYDSVTYCYSCNKELSRTAKTVDAKGHSPKAAVEENRVEASCTEDGGYDTVIYCSVCNDEVKRTHTVIQKKGHSSKVAVEENRVEATCTKDGHYDSVVYCSTCNNEVSRETKTITKLGHSPKSAVEENRVEKTCSTDGHYDSVIYCGRCNEELSRNTITIPAAHTPKVAVQENRVEATCTEDGHYDSVVYCSNCNGEVSRETKTITKLGHSPKSAVEENRVEKTCSIDGHYDSVIYCGRCDDELSRNTITIPAAHTPKVAVQENRVEATCTEDGHYDSVVYCSTCNGELSRETNPITKLGHSPKSAVEEKRIEATCTEDGHYDIVVYCNRCDGEVTRETITLTKFGHSPKSAIEENRVEATCAEDGHYDSVIYCSECNVEVSREKINIPKAHKYTIGSCIFCGGLESSPGLSFTLNLDGASYSLTGKGSFSGSNLVIDIYNNLPVTSIGVEAFSDCTSLTSVTIGNSVTSIGDDAFEYCKNLTSVYIMDIAAWCNISFGSYNANPLYYADYLYLNGELVTELVIPDSVISIDNYAFYSCDSLTSVTIGNGVTSIGVEAFKGCTSLTNVTIGNNVTNIGNSAFYYCTSLASVTIGNGVTSIGKYAFYYCGSLTSVVIGDSVTSIRGYAFEYCKNLTSVTIGNSVANIGADAFKGCYKLVEVIDHSSLGIIKGSSSNGYVGYYAKEVHTGESKIKTLNEYLFYRYNEVNYLLVYVGDEKELVLPESYNGNNYGIYDYAFCDCSSLTSVVIPDSVTSIGSYAFSTCYSLTSIKYRGTAAQWKAITKGIYWISGDCTITYNYTEN